jgi:hypothetical protein
MAIFKDLLGTLLSRFQIGGVTGPNLKANTGRVEIRNAADTAYSPLRAGQVQLNDGDANVITLVSPANIAADYTLTLPVDDGSPNQVLSTDGNGVTSWISAASTADKRTTDTTTIAFGATSPVALFTMPANAVVHGVEVIVDTPFTGAPSLSIGITGQTSKYMNATDNSLTQPVETSFQVSPSKPASGTSENLIGTYAPGGATAGSARVLVTYSVPS